MSAKYISSTLLKTSTSKTGKEVALAIVDRTTAWYRPSGFPSEVVKQDWTKVAEDSADEFGAEVVKIAMKESEHQSDMDKRLHFTAYGLNKNDKEVEVRHLVKHK